MKKAFLFLTMLLFAFMGTMRADEVTVCDGTATNDYVPVYGLYADTQGCQSEFVIPASEIGILPGGQISKLTFYLSTPASAAWTATFQVYMTEIEGTTLSAFVGPSGCTQVYQGALNGTGSTMEVVFDNDYTYNGGNLLIGTFVSTSGNYKSAKFYGVTATGASIQRNSSSASTYQRNFLPKTTFEFVQGDLPATTIVPSENPVQLGVRPIGAWMKPYELAITNQGAPTTVTGVDGTANFAVEAEVPYALGYNGTMPISVTTTGTPAAGTLNGQVLVSYSDRTFTTIDATAEMYEPVDGDVWEMAEEVTAMPFQGNAPAGIYRNYELGQAADAADAVYKVTFDNDVLFSAGTNGAGAKTRLYTEDFNGVGGPDADNNYVYTGPTVNPGPMQMWFAYAYSGTNTWYGTSAGGGFYFGYKIPASYIEELGLEGTSITTVEAAARESYDYECYIIKGGATPFDGELVSFGVAESPEALYFFDINLEEPVLVGADEDIWVIFYSDSPYAAYCGRIPVDATNGKIWTYNPNATSPAWSSNTAYTPVIYTRFLELPTGREVTVDLGSMKIKEGNGVASEIAAVDGTAMGVSKAQMYNEAKAQNTRGNRDTQTLIEEGWENGIGDWTMNNCENSTGVYSSTTSANNGSNCFRFIWTTNTPQYLISPELTDNNGGTMSFYCKASSSSYSESYRIGYSTTTDDISAFTFGDEVTVTSQLYAEHAATFPAGTKYVAIASTAYDAYYFYVDDITITADVTSGGGSTDPVYQIADMYVPAGTYYVAVASTTDNFQVDMMTSEVLVPEQAVVVSPYDGETNVSDPYLAEWILGDYTTEMQVLFGTQYPPQTALIDWTDYLVESAFLMDLEPNQSYFLQVNERNAAGTTMGEIIAFTTPIDAVEGFAVENDQLYPGEAAVFTWEANRTLIGYNIYMDGVKLNDTPITENTYSVEGLEYNMDGYAFQVAAVYGAGESEWSEPITVYMTGTGFISGHVYDAPNGYDPEDPDQTHPVANLPVFIIVTDEYENVQEYEVMTDEDGFYTAEVLAGISIPGISLETAQAYGYAVAVCTQLMVNVAYEGVYEGIDIYTHEYYYPLQQITATDETDDVLVEWSWTPAEMIVDFESGDFSQADFTLPAQYPWAITTTNPHEGTYCMKSTCEGVASGVSSIEATVEVPYYAKMGFWVRVSSESNYDKFHFYIDGVEQGQALSGQLAYQYKEYTVEAGVHTYKWEYAKDSSVNSNDDCVYVDDITMYMQDVPPQPIPGATVYDFENGMQGWTSLDANNDGYGWVLGSEIGGIYLVSGASLAGTGHGSSNDMVCSGSYSNATGAAITPDNYLIAPTQISAQDGAAIQFYACAQDANYAAEHFGVAVSTTTATASAFTTVQEWTMTAKSMGTVDMRSDVRGTRDQGAWYQYTVDLSAYAGQDIWVAIRHFNCTDQFILNVDDITLGDGSAKGFDRAGNRSLMSYNLYRRNNIDEASVEDPELIAEGLDSDVMSYVDNDWTTLPYGEWQWGIQATYEGYAPEPERSRETFTYGFEGGLEGWTGIVVNTDGGEWIHSNNNLGGYDYTTLAHTGTGFAMCYSYVDYDGAYDTDAFLVSPQSYSMDASSQINFFADNANDTYPENFSVWVSTAANPTSASDFTQVWSGGAKGTGSNGAVVRKANNNRYENWREHTIDLSAYAGQEVWIAFRDVNYDQYEIWIDDVTITASSAPVPPTPGPTGNGLSEIIWSNVLDKDMISTVTLNVVLNNGQAPVGAEVELTAIDFEEEYIMDETGTVVIELRKGEYIYEVELDGYTPVDGVLEITEDVEEYTFVLDEIIAPVADFYVSPTGWAMWEGIGGTPGPGPGPQPGTSVTYGFEADEEGWTNIDADGDGNEWYNLNPTNNPNNIPGHDGSLGHMTSASYNGSALTPNNFLVSPEKAAYSEISFWACGQDASWAAEHFGVAVSTTGNTSASDFTTIQEWTMTAKGSGIASVGRDGQTRDQGAWYEYTVDLSAYAGQEIWVAIRHFNVSDMFRLNVDDITLTTGGAKGDRAPLSYKVFLESEFVGETVYPFFQVPVEGLTEGEEYTVGVAPLYATGMGETMYATFTYAACSNYTGATNYAAAVNGNDVTLTWTLPSGGQPGPGPQPGGDTFTEDFEGGLNGWNVLTINADGGEWIHSDDNLGGYDYTALAHSGTGFAMCYSFVDYVGSFNTDSYMYTPQMYTISNGSTLTFWADNANDSYPESFSVVISTAANPASAADFTTVWSGSAKGTASDGAMVRHNNNRYENWRSHTVDLSSYAGQTVYIGFHDVNYDMYEIWIDDVELGIANKGNRAMWDLVDTMVGTSAGQQAVATDGSFIYTASWQSSPTGGYTFYKYDLDGTFVEGFNITGATGIRDLTFDGDYFYGTSGGTQIFCLDLANKTLVGTINCSGLTSRHISYDPERDGFWSGNWSTLALYSRTGSLIQSGAAPSSAYGSAYYKDADGVEHLYLFCQPNSDCQVYDYNIATNTISSSPVLDFTSTTPGCTGIAGGCFIGNYDNKLCWFGNSQQDPNLIGIYELEGTPGPGPGPQPVPGDVLGVMIWRDGEPLTYAPLNASTFTDEAVEAGEHEYCIRVVYSDYAMACDQCETVTVGDTPACDPVTNLTAELYNYQGNDGALIQFTEPAGATSYKVYVDGELLGSISAQPIFINFEGTPDGNYEIGIVAVYANCESDMATTTFAWDAVAENDVVNAIYPNPTSSDLHINATAMTHVTVYNAMGQMVYDQEVSGDELILNMGQYETGVYMVKVTTETGSSVKRINVVK